MTTLPRSTVLATACATFMAMSTTHAAEAATALTLYRSDSAALFASTGDGSVGDGHAVVREQRTLQLKAGTQDVSVGDLPLYLDPEAIALSFANDRARVISQRLLLGQGNEAALAGLVGREITVLGDNGESLAQGTLLRAGSGLLVKGALGNTLVHDYAAVRSSGDDFPTGSSLRLRVDATRAGTATAVLSYPTGGLGWRAAYVATLQPGGTCRMAFESRASIANRSGRDWRNATVELVAGEPSFAKAGAPRPMMAMARGYKAEAADMPQQSALGDYRLYTLPQPVDLPDGSVSQVPLYTTRTLACERTALYENGNAWTPPEPMLSPDFNIGGGNTIESTLRFTAFDSLPAGYLRVLGNDARGTPQFLGEGRIEDTPKGSDATLTLGTAFDLRAERERTSFKLDKSARTMDEAFRITLTNAGESARVVTVREHPSRWREWTLASSSVKPSKQSPDVLEFRVNVPPGGKATLDYAVHYRWAADQ
ncbi:DUF4139 domain-containing protein [Frateuria soli]|uniref:DUF4139 domain-containing protein n=1 Tax=Frateuria soli TaxID=1542730 RepID=UPI001E5C2C36|nr:DUF4139 domain-containing protein [Frateuria soli]UGB39066.1 DUF4139 domain-containing protein [Frateuria soli]